MPPPKHRKKPFSAKQKKEQLQNKREKNRSRETDEFGPLSRRQIAAKNAQSLDDTAGNSSDDVDDNAQISVVRKMNQQPTAKSDKKYDPNKYRLHFARESPAEIEKRKHDSRKPFDNLPEEALEIDIDEVYRPGSVLDMPKRPSWDYNTGKYALLAKEEVYFKQYLDKILTAHSTEQLSYFELNLETWRQQWRVLEISDIILMITDIRHPALHFSPAFYQYVTTELNKPLILVLNKIDLAPPSLVVSWRQYFKEKFPNVNVVCFTSFPREKTSELSADPGKVIHKRRKRRAFSAVGPKQLLEACEEIVQGKVDLKKWQEKIERDIAGIDSGHQVEIRMEEVNDMPSADTVRYKDGILTIGCCGYPNVGKSSLMNGLMGRKVVSVSKTPGHTKHFQTIYLTPTVKLCDSPGLVFPSLIPKPMQILAGIYPIAQVREPYTAVGFLAQRLPLVDLLKIKHPDSQENPGQKSRSPGRTLRWSALDICDAWAEKRGFLTAKAARHDMYRAANHILRTAVEGRVCLCMRPPGYTRRKDEWEKHPETLELARLQSLHHTPSSLDDGPDSLSASGSEGEDEDEEAEVGSEEEVNGAKATNVRGKPTRATLAVSNPFALLGDE